MNALKMNDEDLNADPPEVAGLEEVNAAKILAFE
jgi:hypothetical protein